MKSTKITLALIALTFGVQPVVFAQAQCNLMGAPITDLRDPLINGATSTAPFLPAPDGQPPPMGQGTTPAPVIPGMPGPSTLLPWVPAVPANDIDLRYSGIPLPMDPSVETPPGVLGPLLTPVIPPPPSTPGKDPGNLTAPYGSFNPAADENINPNGGIPGTGGFCTTIPTLRRGGQDTTQWELRGRNSVLGGLGGDGSQDEVTRLGPMSGFGLPFGVPTGDGLRNSSIDLGGGTRFKAGQDTKISAGSSVQDYGLSGMRGNPIGALDAQQSFEFGQGWRRIPLTSSNTTDFGFYYMQFSPANEDPQKKAQLLLPKAVITNF
jgi:hypothetical protein